jgi:hypothetical protein
VAATACTELGKPLVQALLESDFYHGRRPSVDLGRMSSGGPDARSSMDAIVLSRCRAMKAADEKNTQILEVSVAAWREQIFLQFGTSHTCNTLSKHTY